MLCNRLVPLLLDLDGVYLIHHLHAAAPWLLSHLCLIDFEGGVAESAGVAIDASRGPLHVARVDSDVCDTIAVVFVLGFFDELASTDVIDVCRSILTTSNQIAVTIGDSEADLHVSVLVMACELAHWVADPQVP